MCPKCDSDNILNSWGYDGTEKNLCHDCGFKWNPKENVLEPFKKIEKESTEVDLSPETLSSKLF